MRLYGNVKRLGSWVFSGLLSGFYGTYRVLMGVKESYGF